MLRCDNCNSKYLDLEGFGNGSTVYICEDCGEYLVIEDEED